MQVKQFDTCGCRAHVWAVNQVVSGSCSQFSHLDRQTTAAGGYPSRQGL